jgi:hypothetical protein
MTTKMTPEWKNIESAPSDRSVLGFYHSVDGPVFVVIFWGSLPKSVYADKSKWTPPGWQDSYSGRTVSPTHWMPLPQPPKDGGE